MQFLALGDAATQAAIQEVIKYANEHPIRLAEMERARDEGTPLAKDRPGCCVDLPGDYFHVCFTIEEHPVGWCKHISVSVLHRPGRWPHPFAVVSLMEQFGMNPSLSTLFNQNETCTVNFVQPVDATEWPDVIA